MRPSAILHYSVQSAKRGKLLSYHDHMYLKLESENCCVFKYRDLKSCSEHVLSSCISLWSSAGDQLPFLLKSICPLAEFKSQTQMAWCCKSEGSP